MVVPLDKIGPVPEAEPLRMPDQSLDTFERVIPLSVADWRTVLARLVTFGGTLALTGYGCAEMIAVVNVGGVTLLQAVMVILFAVAFAGIALSAASSIAGLFFGGDKPLGTADSGYAGRTALVMPLCNEDSAHSFAALEAMALGLLEHRQVGGFEIFILSDTSQPDIYIRETAAFARLRDAVGSQIPVWYRRRIHNHGRKAGNLRDFVSNWGGRYDYMIVLDADSIMAPQTLVTLVCEMESDPLLGLLQTLPKLAGSDSLYGRLQQFAGAVYGPVVARAQTAWQGDDGNYWGHNAILRMQAFAAAAGLPELPGRRPFGGHILSHDFVEAALMRRAGWSVRMLPDLPGSWEGAPPSLLDAAARDRRWAQGNLQHLAVIRAAGLVWPSRMHLGIGIFSYLASPVWLALIVVGLAVAVQGASAHYQYFSDEITLFPDWPLFDSERMVWLFVFTMSVLFLSKVLGVVRALFNRHLRKSVGCIRLLMGFLAEILLAALYAPVCMMMQSRQVFEILVGRDSGWKVQSRRRSAMPTGLLFRRHWVHTLFGAGIAYELLYIAPDLLPWMMPALLGLALAIPLSAASGSALIGKLFRASGLLLTPEEILAPEPIKRRNAIAAELAVELEMLTLESLVADEDLCRRHLAATLPRPAASRGKPDLEMIAVRTKLADAHTLNEALDWLSTAEKVALLGDKESLLKLIGLARPAV